MIGLTAGDITIEGETAFYYYYRGKGGKRGRRELPRPAYDALRATLGDAGYGAPDRIRTCDLRLRRPTLYPLSYRRARAE